MTEKFMKSALLQAKVAQKRDEVPIGAVVVKGDKIISRAHNTRNASGDATAHAEILAIRRACKKLGDWRLSGCDLYVTLEPCVMCLGACFNARIANVYFGAYDVKAGGCGSKINIFEKGKFNHNVEYSGGYMQDECARLLSNFFAEKRAEKIKSKKS